MAEEEEEEENVVMFPFMAQGHLIPFLALAMQIEQRKGYTVTFVNTPLNIQKLRSSLPPDTTICLVELPFCAADYGLPPDKENTDSLSYELIVSLLEASETLKSPFKNLLLDITKSDGRAPLCIIADMFLGWTVEVARELGIFHSVFIAGAGYGMAVYFSLSLNMPQCHTDADEFELPDFPEASPIHRSQLTNDQLTDGTDSWSLFRVRQLSFCLCSNGILLNTIEGLEEYGMRYFSTKMGGRPVWPVGPACSSVKRNGDKNIGTIPSERDSPSGYSCFEWLDLHPPASVLYVSFGSQNTISDSQIMELAMGLEASGKAFIWVVRPPIGFGITEDFRAEWLPEGFEDRIKSSNQGLLIRKWAPQLEILSHKSTCAFLSHCGWNSVLESLTHGIPLIGWPLAADQFFNSQMLEKNVGVCIEVARGISSEVIGHDHIARVITTVMGDSEKGQDMRRKACRIEEMMKDAIRVGECFEGSSIKAMDEFVSSAVVMRKVSRVLTSME